MIFEKDSPWYGGVAQLGEHLPCKQGVMGSNPIISTSRQCRHPKLGVIPRRSKTSNRDGKESAKLKRLSNEESKAR